MNWVLPDNLPDGHVIRDDGTDYIDLETVIAILRMVAPEAADGIELVLRRHVTKALAEATEVRVVSRRLA